MLGKFVQYFLTVFLQNALIKKIYCLRKRRLKKQRRVYIFEIRQMSQAGGQKWKSKDGK